MRRVHTALSVALLALGLTGGCGGTDSVGSIGGDAGPDAPTSGDASQATDAPRSADGSNDAPPPANGPIPCGTTTCGATSYCVHPCCGGAPPACVPKSDGGTCPAGTHPSSCIAPGGEGCEADPCTPPPPYCTDDLKSLPFGCQSEPQHPRDVNCVCA
jgi:hypothetical protein